MTKLILQCCHCDFGLHEFGLGDKIGQVVEWYPPKNSVKEKHLSLMVYTAGFLFRLKCTVLATYRPMLLKSCRCLVDAQKTQTSTTCPDHHPQGWTVLSGHYLGNYGRGTNIHKDIGPPDHNPGQVKILVTAHSLLVS